MVKRLRRVSCCRTAFGRAVLAAIPRWLIQPIIEDGVPTVITGVLPPAAAAPAQGALPLDQAFVRLNLPRLNYPRDWQLFNVVARLRPGVSVAQAQAELSGVAAE